MILALKSNSFRKWSLPDPPTSLSNNLSWCHPCAWSPILAFVLFSPCHGIESKSFKTTAILFAHSYKRFQSQCAPWVPRGPGPTFYNRKLATIKFPLATWLRSNCTNNVWAVDGAISFISSTFLACITVISGCYLDWVLFIPFFD